MRATIIGVAAPANPPPLAQPPAIPVEQQPTSSRRQPAPVPPSSPEHPRPRTGVMPAVSRQLKRTMIGGLEASPGSAPSPQAIGLGIPAETKWTVLLAGTGASAMSAPDIVRAFAEGKVTHESKLWREGLDGWKSLWEVEPIRVAFERAGLSLHPAPTSQHPAAPEAKVDLPPDSKTAARPPVKTEVAHPDWESLPAEPTASALPNRPRSVPAPTPLSAQREDSLAPPEAQPAPATARPDIGPRETLRGEVRALSSAPPSPPLPPPSRPSSTEPKADTTAASQPAVATLGEMNTEVGDKEPEATPLVSPPSKQHRRRRRGLAVLTWLLVFAAVVVAATFSYRTRQPKALYGYLQRKHWDKPLDRQVDRLVVRPYRSAEKQIRAFIDKAKHR